MNNNFDSYSIPRHIGIIMDGNRRFAKKKLMPAEYGHMSGARNFLDIAEHCSRIGLQAATFYAFSTENFNRSKEEKNHLQHVVESMFGAFQKLVDNLKLKVVFLGDKSAFSQNWIQKMIASEQNTSENSGMILNIAVNYGGRPEILRAAKLFADEIIAGRLKPEDLDERMFDSLLYTASSPQLDMVIRTGGEVRLSNFLLWQSAYAELFFEEKYWPEYKCEDLDRSIAEFQSRVRNFGG